MEKQRFIDKIALVTGGANGLGRGMTEQLVKEGSTGHRIFDIEDDTMDESTPITSACIACIATYATNAKCMRSVAKSRGVRPYRRPHEQRGHTHRQPFLECSQEGWLDVMDTNLNGVFYVGQAVARTMADKGIKGYIVNTSSNSARKTIGGITPYGPSKAAVSMLTQVMALELAKYDIHVNAVAPGHLEDPHHGRHEVRPGAQRRLPGKDAVWSLWRNRGDGKRRPLPCLG